MTAIICVTGHDSVGIIASVSALCAKYGANIIDINQSVMEDYFTMVMMVEIDKLTIPFAEFSAAMKAHGQEKSLDIHTMHEDIFNSMHRI